MQPNGHNDASIPSTHDPMAPMAPTRSRNRSWAVHAIVLAALSLYAPSAHAQAPQPSEESSYISEQYSICKDDIGACSGLISEYAPRRRLRVQEASADSTVGCIAVVAGALLLLWLWRRRRHRHRDEAAQSQARLVEEAKEDAIAEYNHRAREEHMKNIQALLQGPIGQTAQEEGKKYLARKLNR